MESDDEDFSQEPENGEAAIFNAARESATPIHWHANRSFRLIRGRHWRALIDMTTNEFQTTLGNLFARLPPLDFQQDDHSVRVEMYAMYYPPKTVDEFRILAEIAFSMGAFECEFYRSLEDALQLMKELAEASKQWQESELPNAALAYFLAVEVVAVSVCRRFVC